MKNFTLKRLLPLLLTFIMLFSATLPTLGASISAPNDDEPYYTVVFEDGVLTLQIDPDKLYEIIKDRNISKEELKNFLPEDVYATLTDGTALTPGDLVAIAAHHFTVDDIIAIKT